VGELALVFPIAAATGASLPPVAPAVRSLWRNLVDEDVLSQVYAVDATLQEVTFMVGPALVAVVSSLVSPAAALAASGAIGLVGTLAVSAQRATSLRPAPQDEAAAGPRPRARSGGLLVLVAVTALLLLGIGVVEVGVVAFAGEHHAAHQAGLLLMVWSAGSFVGGLSIGGRVAAGGARAVVWLMGASAVGFALLAAAPAVGVLYPLLFVAGTAIAPGFSCIYSLVGRLAPEGAAVEAFSWVASAIQFGAAAGAAIGGVLAQSAGTRFAMLSAGAVGLVAVVVALSGRRLLSARPAGVLHPAALD
jgi:predicted MFS family arabinose efflux permease